MLQQRALNRRALASLDAGGAWWPEWESMAELEVAADLAVERLRGRRLALSAAAGGLTAARARVDAWARSDTRVEYLDRPEVSPAEKSALIQKLHRLNRLVLSYRRWLSLLRPTIERVARRERRPARVLELASGAGEFSLELARAAERQDLPVEIIGSDIVGAYVDAANAKAARRALPVRFRRLDALNLESLTPGDFDLVFIIQSVHHFTPGQLARMIAQARYAGAARFIAIDGRRSLALMGLVPLLTTAAAPLDGRLLHDGWVSARRFYAEEELALIARVAAPGARAQVRRAEPGFSLLTVRF